jgi:hypothetical protein
MLSLQVKPALHSLSEVHEAPSPPPAGESSPHAAKSSRGSTKSDRDDRKWGAFMSYKNDTYGDPEQDRTGLKPCGSTLGFV